MERRKALDFPQGILNLFDRYVHGDISRREFLDGAARFAAGGITAAAIFESLRPNYAWAQHVAKDDARIQTEYATCPSPQGSGTIRGYLVLPAKSGGKLPGVMVVHENRGLNTYIEDVARRVALENFVSFAPDALTPLGGYPGDDEQGGQLFRQLDPAKRFEDFIASANFLKTHPACSGKFGVVGFCFGGGIANMLAVRMPDLAAAVSFYGSQPPAAEVPKINAPLLIHYAGLDTRINDGWPAYEGALKAGGKTYTMHMYDNTNHGFHNDTTPRHDKVAAELAWLRTIEFFNRRLR